MACGSHVFWCTIFCFAISVRVWFKMTCVQFRANCPNPSEDVFAEVIIVQIHSNSNMAGLKGPRGKFIPCEKGKLYSKFHVFSSERSRALTLWKWWIEAKMAERSCDLWTPYCMTIVQDVALHKPTKCAYFLTYGMVFIGRRRKVLL